MSIAAPSDNEITHGALVVSLDFELAWGVHDVFASDGPYRANLLGVRDAVPRILELFERYGVAATWATVGFLFAESSEELEAYRPPVTPSYDDRGRDPYRIRTGEGEHDDPLHFAPSLIRDIAAVPGQEIGSHTFSHYYCLDSGQTVEQFEADLGSAVAIADAKGYALRSLVLPRHQVRADYLPAIARAGFVAHRGPEPHRLARPGPSFGDALSVRGARLVDSYLPLTGANVAPWSSTTPDVHGLVDVRESRFLRPVSKHVRGAEALRVARIVQAMRQASRSRGLLHVWWHPHNFGVELEANLANLRALLDEYARLRDAEGFASYSMGDVARIARKRAALAPSRP